jgi:hypothetical protein
MNQKPNMLGSRSLQARLATITHTELLSRIAFTKRLATLNTLLFRESQLSRISDDRRRAATPAP